MTAPPEKLVDMLRSALAAGPPIRLALLFGSAARGRARPNSDLDVGVVPLDTELSLHAELELQAILERACGRSVHLVRLDRADTLLRWEAACYGIPILSRSPADRARFIAAAALEHADIAPNIARAGALFRERMQALDKTETA